METEHVTNRLARSKEMALRAIARGGPNRDMFVRLHMGYVVGFANRKKQKCTPLKISTKK